MKAEEKPTRRRLAAAVFAVLVIAVVAVLYVRNRPHQPPPGAAPPAPETAATSKTPIPAALSTASDLEPDELEKSVSLEVSKGIQQAAPPPLSNAQVAAIEGHRAVKIAEAEQKWKEYWLREDEVYARMPKYEKVRDEYRAKAQELLDTLAPGDTAAILALERKELDAFWDSGSLASEESYPHGYLARALAELAVEKDPENFRLLYGLADAIETTVLRFDAENQPLTDSYAPLRPVLDKMQGLIMSGRAPVTPEAMLALWDWIHVASLTSKFTIDVVPAYQWLIDNADDGGWSYEKSHFAEGRDSAKQRGYYGTHLRGLSAPAKYMGDGMVLHAMNSRRWDLCSGSPKWREASTRYWERRTEEPK